MILNWPRHIQQNCPEGTDDYRCHNGTCVHQNLFCCSRCGGAEGDLPTDCPGEQITSDDRQAIYAEQLNYLRPHGWVKRGDRRFVSNTVVRTGT